LSPPSQHHRMGAESLPAWLARQGPHRAWASSIAGLAFCGSVLARRWPHRFEARSVGWPGASLFAALTLAWFAAGPVFPALLQASCSNIQSENAFAGSGSTTSRAWWFLMAVTVRAPSCPWSGLGSGFICGTVRAAVTRRVLAASPCSFGLASGLCFFSGPQGQLVGYIPCRSLALRPGCVHGDRLWRSRSGRCADSGGAAPRGGFVCVGVSPGFARFTESSRSGARTRTAIAGGHEGVGVCR